MKQAHTLLWLASITAGMVWQAAACAQGMNDPTRPPAGIYLTEGATGATSGPRLQSVMITPGERSAIIDGERVRLGGKYGDARVIRITESEVVLRSSGGTETLKMYPEVEMKAVKPAAPVPAVQKSARKFKSNSK